MTKKESRHAELVSASQIIDAPYELPEGWKWVRLVDVCETLTGSTPSKKRPEFYGGSFPFFKPADLDQGMQLFEASEYLSELGKKCSRFIPAHSTLICCIGSIGKSGYSLRDGTSNQQINAAIPRSIINSKFLFYAVNSENFKNQLWENSSSTTISIINKSKMDNCILPLPPLLEQQRIISRIESMFAKLDEAKEKAQNVVDSFETRKAAILHQAFTGNLTAKWRKENGVSDDSWEIKQFDEIAEIKSNLVDVADYQDFPHIAPDNIEKKTGVLLDYHTIAEDKVTSGKHRFYPGQILYSKIRPYLSKVVMVDFDGLCSADMYPIEAKENTKFLWYQMLSNEFLDKASNSGSRSVLPKINQKELSVIPMKICTRPEQQEIVHILDTVLEKERTAKFAAEQVLEQIELLKKSILARAFRGEL